LHCFHSLFTRSATWRPQPASKAARLKPSGRAGRSFSVAVRGPGGPGDPGLPPAGSEEGGHALETIGEGTERPTRRFGVVSYLDSRDPIFLGRGGGRLFSWDSCRVMVPWNCLFQSFINWQARLKISCGPLSGGEARAHRRDPLNFDIRKASADDVRRGESLVIPRPSHSAGGFWQPDRRPDSIGGWPACHRDHSGNYGIPGAALALVHSGQNLATMLGLGLGIDYALLMVSRFREAISAGTTGLRPLSSRHAKQVARSWFQPQR